MKRRPKKLETVLGSWEMLNSWIMNLTEDELAEILRLEMHRKPKRRVYIRRIHQRITRLRGRRERVSLSG